jgi:soluble lytic murein transglycosylase-like protein
MNVITWENKGDGTVATSADGAIFTTPTLSANRAAGMNGVHKRWGNAIRDGIQSLGSSVPQALAEAIVYVESGGDENAMGKAGEVGLFQILPSTAHLGIDQLLNAGTNIRAGITYLQSFMGHGYDIPAVVSMYNAGTNPKTGRPYMNDETSTAFQSEYGYRSAPGYIDAVIRGNNYLLTGMTDMGAVSQASVPRPVSRSGSSAILLGIAILGAYKMKWL